MVEPDMEVTLRPATEEDIPFLLDLRVMTMSSYLNDNGVPSTEEENLYRIRYNFEDAQIVEVRGQRAGLFKVSHLADLNCWYVFQIQIHPEYQNFKIGSYLLKSLINKAKREAKGVRLGVLKGSPALKLYIKLGFTVIEENEQEYELLLQG